MITENAALIERAQQGDKNACERVLSENEGLIWSIVRRYCGRGVEPEELYQLGCLGFIKAVQGFDPTYETQFSTYAVPKIAGEIRRFLRDDMPVKLARGKREEALSVRSVQDRLCMTLGREPTLSELSAETGLAVEELSALEIALTPPESLQQKLGDDITLEQTIAAVDERELTEHLALRQSVEQLPEQERMTILLRFYKGLTQERTARVVGVSQVQISRLERRALQKLREMLS